MDHREQIRTLIEQRRPLVVGAISESEGMTVTPIGCDVIELRLDSLGTPEAVQNYAASSPLPVLLTARGNLEGGQSDWTFEERAEAFRTLLSHAALIDIELRDFEFLDEVIEEAREAGVTVVGSFHDFEKTPPAEELLDQLHPMADLHKFALMAQSPKDITSHLSLAAGLAERPFAVMGMGPLGAAARPLMASCGSLLNYGYLGRTPTAPNQWPAKLLAETLFL